MIYIFENYRDFFEVAIYMDLRVRLPYVQALGLKFASRVTLDK